jgi:hypothetical protein
MLAVWAEMRREDLEIDWELAANKQEPKKIEPLR